MTKRPKGKSRKPLLVRHTSGVLQPFLRGMLTHDLVQRGLSFDDAYAVARTVRDRLADRLEIDTSEMRDVIAQTLEELLPDFDGTPPPVRPEVGPALSVTYGGRPQPFSRGLLARSLVTAGLDLDRCYALVLELQRDLLNEGVTTIDARRLAGRVAKLLEATHGKEAAGRYLLVRRIQRLPKPLVIYCGGASGTGKSTLALELAPLLRIYRINATDTIRQVMRMVFSPAILPSLHRSSFEALPAGFHHLDEDPSDEGREALIRSFEEQATQVCVGVRAVVERCLAENVSTMVEGVHLLPSLVPFHDLEGAAYQQLFLLSTLDQEAHRAHFLSRANLRSRPPAHYLDHFPAIRLQQQHLLEQAEEREVPLLDTADQETMIPRALRLLSGALERQLPWLAQPHSATAEPDRALLLIIDGMPDHPVRALAGRTPLEAASTPFLDRIAREGRCGLADAVAPGVVPDTAAGNLALFGQAPGTMNRGPIEAIGAGIELEPDDIALRANLATLDDHGFILDRRADRIRGDTARLAKALNGLEIPGHPDVEVIVAPSTEHRLAVVLRGPDLSSAITGSDPGELAPPGPPLVPEPTDGEDESAKRTAGVLAAFEKAARKVLAKHPVNRRRGQRGKMPANVILTRGAGRIHRLVPLRPGGYPLSLACVCGDRTVLGIARVLGAECISKPEMTANLDTDLRLKFDLARAALDRYDLVVVHVKGADIAAHDGRADLKVEFLERLDHELGRFLKATRDDPCRIAVASDHATVSETGQHAADAIPVAVWGRGIDADEVEGFDERLAVGGSLGRFNLQLLIERLFEPTI